MKKSKLIVIVSVILIFGCKQEESKKAATIVEKSADKSNHTVQKQEAVDGHTNLTDEKIAGINSLIELFKLRNADKISRVINYPLQRQYPIPAIKSKEEFTQRFSEVFDNILVDRIANSKISQWSEMGWRGIMLDDGIVWMANSDGIITTVNYESEYEKKLRSDLIAGEKENVYTTLQTFKSPTYKIKTKNYLIRIDELTSNKYRYASWKINEKESSKPDIIINNGTLEFQGSGGNHLITFIEGKYTYNVYRNIIGEKNSPDFTLEIEDNGKIILSEDGTLYQ